MLHYIDMLPTPLPNEVIMQHTPPPRVLFILKKRPPGPYDTWCYSNDGRSLPSGLTNSVDHLVLSLTSHNIDCKAVQVVDNNCIDREVTAYKPTHVVIEAFWVVPTKFDVLKPLHPNVTWLVRNHSKSDFLSYEGGMIGWALDYLRHGVILACNSPEAVEDFRRLASHAGDADPRLIVYLPNTYYGVEVSRPIRTLLWAILRALGIYGRKPTLKVPGQISVGCYGAIRPLKNHMNQALAAMRFADDLGVALHFHINATRIEGKADALLTSLRRLFSGTRHTLIEDPWMETPEFKRALSSLDMLTQVSLSETFNLVGADAVSVGIPVLGSSEIPWLNAEAVCDPDVASIHAGLHRVWRRSGNHYLQRMQAFCLATYSSIALRLWKRFLGSV